MKKIIIPQKELEVISEYDVIVLGGGVAGSFAGITAARKGLKTLIIEQFGALGGSSTLGLVTPLMSSHLPHQNGHCQLSEEVVSRMRKLGGHYETDDLSFDTTMLKFVLEDMVVESGCSLLYYTSPVEVIKENDVITHVILHNKDGICAYSSKYFIDCTGDADFAVMAGVPYESGNHNKINQPVSLRFEMAGIDFEAFHQFMKSLGNNAHKYFAMNTAGMKEILIKAHEDGLLTKQDIVYFQAFGIPGKETAMNFNCPELTTKENIVDAAFITQKQIEGKKAILRLKRFLKERIPGFSNAYITEVATFVGIRESRRIEADYIMTIEDILAYKKFDDAVVASKYPVDVHGVDDVTLGLQYDNTLPKQEQFWEVPYRCMLAKDTQNLLVAGRCAGLDFRAQSAVRIMLICRAMGEAAGLACTLAQEKNQTLREIDGKEICRQMKAKK